MQACIISTLRPSSCSQAECECQKTNKIIIISFLTFSCVITLAPRYYTNAIIPEDQANTLILWHHEYLIAMLDPVL